LFVCFKKKKTKKNTDSFFSVGGDLCLVPTIPLLTSCSLLMATKKVYHPDAVITTGMVAQRAPSIVCGKQEKNGMGGYRVPFLLHDSHTVNLQLSGGGNISFIKAQDVKPDEKDALRLILDEKEEAVAPAAATSSGSMFNITNANKLTIGFEVLNPVDLEGAALLDSRLLDVGTDPKTYFMPKPNCTKQEAEKFCWRPTISPEKADGNGGMFSSKIVTSISPVVKTGKLRPGQRRPDLIQYVTIKCADGDLACLPEEHPLANLTLEDLKKYTWTHLMFKLAHMHSNGSTIGIVKYLRMIRLGPMQEQKPVLDFIDTMVSPPTLSVEVPAHLSTAQALSTEEPDAKPPASKRSRHV
jgi:hypothetical protein